MDFKHFLFLVGALLCLVLCYAEASKLQKRAVAQDESTLNDEDESPDKRIFRYGRGSIFRYGRAPAVFRYGKRAPVFRYGKRADEDVDGESVKRIFRWGKRDDDQVKRLFRWGKRAEDEDEDTKRAHVFRYGKRADIDDEFESEYNKRRIFNFGKRGDATEDIDIRADSPHVPFRFGEDE